MAQLNYGANQITLGFKDNTMLANLQVATARRFATSKGYFLTSVATVPGGEVSVSHWISPGEQLRFVYDSEDDYGNAVETAMVDEDDVVKLLEAMDWPTGVSYDHDDRGLPFLDEAMRAAVESAPSVGE